VVEGSCTYGETNGKVSRPEAQVVRRRRYYQPVESRATFPEVEPTTIRTGIRGDVVRTLAVCRQVVEDRDATVVKAVSWALRSLVEWDRAAVAGFLIEHESTRAGRVKREVSTKLRTGRKQ